MSEFENQGEEKAVVDDDSIDLFDMTPADTVEVELMHNVSGIGMGLFFTMKSQYHKDVVAVKDKMQDQRFQKRKHKVTSKSVNDSVEEQLKVAVTSWRFAPDSICKIDGGRPDFSTALLKRAMKIVWITDFLSDALGDDELFFKT